MSIDIKFSKTQLSIQSGAFPGKTLGSLGKKDY